MKTGVDTCQARRIHKSHSKLLWTNLTFEKLAPEVQRVSQLAGLTVPEDSVTPPGCLGCLGTERPALPSERNYITTCQKRMLASEACGLIARLGDARRCIAMPSTPEVYSKHIRS